MNRSANSPVTLRGEGSTAAGAGDRSEDEEQPGASRMSWPREEHEKTPRPDGAWRAPEQKALRRLVHEEGEQSAEGNPHGCGSQEPAGRLGRSPRAAGAVSAQHGKRTSVNDLSNVLIYIHFHHLAESPWPGGGGPKLGEG